MKVVASNFFGGYRLGASLLGAPCNLLQVMIGDSCGCCYQVVILELLVE